MVKVTFDNTCFGIKKDVKTYNYSPSRYIKVTKVDIKDLHYISRKEFIQETLHYSLSSIYKAGKWLKSKLTYFKDGKEVTTIRSKAK